MFSKYRTLRSALLSALEVKSRLPELEKSTRDVNLRVRNLEFCLDAMIGDPKFNPATHWAFNGQLGRQALFRRLLEMFSFDLVLETGTFLGETTGYFASTMAIPVHTCELNHRFHAVAKLRLDNYPGIHFFQGDSRNFLKQVSQGGNAGKFPFIYLDAHWYDDLPLCEELEIIDGAWNQYIVMVDDFKVPFDLGYTYDDYGPGKCLNAGLISTASTERTLSIFYPSLPSQDEVGSLRGCAVIASDPVICQRLDQENILRR